MNKKFAIVIPVYKDNPSEEERISLYRIQQIMGEYPIYYVVPKKIKETVKDSNLCPALQIVHTRAALPLS